MISYDRYINRDPGVAITPAVCSVTNFFTICKYWPGRRSCRKKGVAKVNDAQNLVNL